MGVTATLLYQKSGENFKTNLIQIVFTGNYPGTPGEVLSLLAKNLLNPAARTLSGGNVNLAVPPRAFSTQGGGWRMELKPTANAGEFNVSLWNGNVELTAIAYPAPVLAGVFLVEVDHNLQGY
jgi:hypothetical protein